MKKNINISGLILQVLQDNRGKIFKLDELVQIIFPMDGKEEEKENQAIVLDFLIFLDDQKMIVLDFETDECSIPL
ncbi:hypothetical protein [Flavobacterium sp.]|uniref:hypothetical protein n=1 Tax=Flavobacterium sp. TaxID=239 RepID=UPI0031E169D6